MRRYALALLIVLSTVGCPTDPVQETYTNTFNVNVELSSKRGSCGFLPTLYQLGCMTALEIIVNTDSQTFRQCETLERSYDTLLDFLAASTFRMTLDEQVQEVDQVFTVAIRGLASSDGDACLENTGTSDWILFGESAVINLPTPITQNNTDSILVSIPFDCLDCFGGCASWNTDSCSETQSRVCFDLEDTQPGTSCLASSSCPGSNICVQLSGEDSGFCRSLCPLTPCSESESCLAVTEDEIL